jgi:hypothetical protein
MNWLPVRIGEIIEIYNPGPGSHWFDPGTKRFFRTRLGRRGYRGPGGTYFVTSEQGPRMPRRYTVRRLVGPGRLETVGVFCGYKTAASATRAAKRAAYTPEGAE